MVTLYPTETVYGLGVDVFEPQALDLLYKLKGRDAEKASSWLVRDMSDIERYAIVSPAAAKIAKRFLPGPLTLVLPVREKVRSLVRIKERTIGFRISSDPIAQKLITESLHPLTCTSANVSGMPTMPIPSAILAQFGERAGLIDTVIDDGPRHGMPSTVVRVMDGNVEVLRAGAVAERAILEVAQSS